MKAGVFAAAIVAVSLFLQRFAVPAGDKGIDVVGAIGLLLAGVAVWRGDFVVDRRRLTLFLCVLLWVMVGNSLRATFANVMGVPFSFNSFGQFVLLNSFCMLSFSKPVDEPVFFRAANLILAVIAAAGILEFFGQFAGISLFSFSGLVPDKFLFESGYNVVIPTGVGSLDKANGFFLLEPSIFSQAMATALIIEILTFRRLHYLLLFCFALMAAFSGTGLMVLAAFLLTTVGGLRKRGLWVGVAGLVAAVGVAVGIFYFAPEFANIFLHRIDELNSPSSSGYARFRSPFMALRAAWDRQDGAWLLGIGAGGTRRLNLPFSYDANTPVKIMLEFGVPALVFYFGMIMNAQRTRIQKALLLPTLVLLFFTGGYEEFAPVLFPIFLLICVPRLRPSRDTAVGSYAFS